MAFSLEMLAISAGLSVLCQRYVPQYSVGFALNVVLLFLVQFTAYQTWKVVIYPRLFSPLRHLPTPPDNKFFTGQTFRLLREPSAMPARDWVENLPNDGLIRCGTPGRMQIVKNSLMRCIAILGMQIGLKIDC